MCVTKKLKINKKRVNKNKTDNSFMHSYVLAQKARRLSKSSRENNCKVPTAAGWVVVVYGGRICRQGRPYYLTSNDRARE